MAKSNFQQWLHVIPPCHFCPLCLFIFLFSEWGQYGISPAWPIYLIQSLCCNWNFYWDEGDNSCKCANQRMALGRDVKPSAGIKKKERKGLSVKCCPPLCHVSAPIGHSWLADSAQPMSLPLTAIEDVEQSRTSTRTQDAVCYDSPESLSSLLLKGKWMCKHISHANSIMEHMLRQLCDYNQAACEECRCLICLSHVTPHLLPQVS